MPHFTNLGDLVRRDLDLTRTAIIDLGGETSPREFSHADLDAAANGVARALTKRGLASGDRVAILSANRFEYLAAYYGTMRAGFISVPVNFKFPRELIHYILHDSGAKLVFCDAARRADCPPDLPVVDFSADDASSYGAFVDSGPFDTVVPAPHDAAMFLYTSGSSGKPKGVILSHESHIWVAQTRLGKQDISRHRYLIAAPLYHMNALALSKLAAVGHAGIVMLPQFDARGYIEAIGTHRCTMLTAVPPMLAMVLRETDVLDRTDLSSVEIIRLGSAPVSQALMAGIKGAFPKAQVVNAYGTTEAGPVVFGPHPQGLAQPEMSVGCRHPLVELRLVPQSDVDGSLLVDGDSPAGSRPPSTEQRGVLEMKCPAVMSGYHNRPDLKRPITDDGFYVTGDVFRVDEQGFYYFVGRSDDMFVSGGENIYPADVERMLERHPAIAQAAVVPVDDDIKGTKPVAFAILKPGQTADEDAIKQFALANAPAYQHPRSVWFVDELPLASTNKLDRAALKADAARRVGALRA